MQDEYSNLPNSGGFDQNGSYRYTYNYTPPSPASPLRSRPKRSAPG